MSALDAIFATQFNPSDVGHGGNHRAYQILHDLELALGQEHVTVVSFTQWKDSKSDSQNRLLHWGHKIRRRLLCYGENPFKLFAFTPYSKNLHNESDFSAYYKNIARHISKPAFGVVEHTGFSDLIKINTFCGFPTLACVQNLESLDSGVPTLDFASGVGTLTRAIDFGNELKVLRRCSERLLISKVEAGLIGGLGLRSDYYPYLPVGKIRQRQQRIRMERSKTPPRAGLLVVLGSARHLSTRDGFRWFVQEAQKHGLPQGVHAVFVGAETDRLWPKERLIPQIELRGELAQDALDQLLVTAEAVVVPQFWGFGALTRVTEMACAGIPVLVSRHAAYAMDLPPGAKIIDDSWHAWCEGIVEVGEFSHTREVSDESYQRWEEAQPRTLTEIVSRFRSSLSRAIAA